MFYPFGTIISKGKSNIKVMKTIEQVSKKTKELIVKLADLAKVAHFMKTFSNSEDSIEYFTIHENTLSASKAILFKGLVLQSKDHALLFGSRWAPALVYFQMRLLKFSDSQMIDLLENQLAALSNQVDDFTLEVKDPDLVKSLNQVSNNLMILISALNTQRIYTLEVITEAN